MYKREYIRFNDKKINRKKRDNSIFNLMKI